MTNKERLIAFLGFQPSSEAVDAALLDADISAQSDYVKENHDVLKRAAVTLFELLLTTPNQTNDVGTSITYDRNAAIARMNQYKLELGISLTSSGVRDKSHLW